MDLAFIDKPAFFNFYERYQAEERRTKASQSGGGNFFANQKFRIGKRFAESVILATKEGSPYAMGWGRNKIYAAGKS